MKGGTTVIAFVTDPDGYKIELIERDALSAAGAASRARKARTRSPRASRVDARPVGARDRVGRRQPRAADDLDVGSAR